MAATRRTTDGLGQRAGDPVRPSRGNGDRAGPGYVRWAAKRGLPGISVGASRRRYAPRALPQTSPLSEIPIAHGPGPRLPPLEAFGRRPSARSEPARMGRHPKPFTTADIRTLSVSGPSELWFGRQLASPCRRAQGLLPRGSYMYGRRTIAAKLHADTLLVVIGKHSTCRCCLTLCSFQHVARSS
jgi:hypothetical protein